MASNNFNVFTIFSVCWCVISSKMIFLQCPKYDIFGYHVSCFFMYAKFLALNATSIFAYFSVTSVVEFKFIGC